MSDLKDLNKDAIKKPRTLIKIFKVFLVVFLALLFLTATCMPGTLAGIKLTHERACVLKLREIADAEKAHYEIFDRYESFENLTKNELNQNDLDKQNIIKGYDLALFYVSEDSSESKPSFLIVAIPDNPDSSLFYLPFRIFAVS